jgi:hypothetical protein
MTRQCYITCGRCKSKSSVYEYVSKVVFAHYEGKAVLSQSWFELRCPKCDAYISKFVNECKPSPNLPPPPYEGRRPF